MRFYRQITPVLERYLSMLAVIVPFFLIISMTLALILTFLGWFKFPLVFGVTIFSFISSLIFFSWLKKREQIQIIKIEPLLLVIAITTTLILFPHDSFGGRDEAVYSNLAVYLAEHGTIKLPSYLNNLSYNFAEMVSTTLPGYTVWLAIQKMFFNNQWLLRSNVILNSFGLLSLYLVAKRFGGRIIGLLTLILYSSNMAFLWFSRETMSENLTFFILWTLIYYLLEFIKTGNLIFLLGILGGGWVISFTRVEGFFMQLLLVLILIVISFFKKLLTIRQITNFLIVYSILLGSYFSISKHSTFDTFFFNSLLYLKNNVFQEITPLMTTLETNGKSFLEPTLYEKIPSFVINMLTKLNLTLVFASIVFVFLNELIHIKKKKRLFLELLMLIIIMLPEFWKLVNPSVTLDQPWLYRRYVYALLPLGYMALVIFLNKFRNRFLFYSLFCGFFIINLLLSKDILFLKNNWFLADKLENISKDISSEDLVIIRNNTLNHYYPGSFLILQKGIRNVFTSELSKSQFLPEEKLFNGGRYERLFLLSTEENEQLDQFFLKKEGELNISYSQLQHSCQLFLLGRYLKLPNVYNYSMLPYDEALKYCNKPGYQINHYNETLSLYELKRFN